MDASVPRALFIGLMSGTSLDGVDGVLADFGPSRPQVLAHASIPFPDELRDRFLSLNRSGVDELRRAALAAQELVNLYARVVNQLLARTGLPATAICAIGAHGQTVRHQPPSGGGDLGYSVQVNHPALLAELCAIDVVADFRSRDLAAGGQGAPLVPAFHQAWFARPGETVAVLNLGGIANLSLLGVDGHVIGFDCGPGNVLLDGWCQRHTGAAYDHHGEWAAGGQVQSDLLARLMAEPFLAQHPPKSTGRDLFHLHWLERQLQGLPPLPPQDVQATLAAFTAQAAAEDLRRQAPGASRLVVCGGGALNRTLMRELARRVTPVPVETSDEHGLPALQVEATAFAWLAERTVRRAPSSLPAVTGARGPRVLGALYPR